MATLVLRPTTFAGGATTWTVVGADTPLDAVSDGDDSSWVRSQELWPWSYRTAAVTFEAPQLPSGARIARVRARTRVDVEWTTDPDDYAPGELLLAGVVQASPLVVSTIQQVDGPRLATQPGAGGAWTAAALDGIDVVFWFGDSQYGSTLHGRIYDVWLEVDYHERPTVTPTAPAATVTETTRPTLAWDYDQPDGLDQSAWRVAIVDDDGTTVWDTGWTDGPATQVQPTTDLDNGETYHAQYAVRAKWPGLGHLESTVATRTFTLDLVTPAAPTVAVTPTPTQGRTLIEIDDPGGDLDAEWYSVEYHDGDSRWTTLRAAGHLDATAGPVLVWDHEAPFNRARTYRVRAHAQVGAEQVASPPTDVDGTLNVEREWLTDPRDPAGLHLPVNLLEHATTWQGREEVHLPAGMDVAVVESEPAVEQRTVAMWTDTPEKFETLRSALRSTRTLLYRDRRTSIFFRWIGDRQSSQFGPVTSGIDTFEGTMVEVARPCT